MTGPQTAAAAPRPRLRAAVLLFDGVEELDFAGPYDVLATWQDLQPEAIVVTTIAEGGAPVRGGHGLRVTPDGDWPDAPGQLDLLVIPGGCTFPVRGQPAVNARLRALHAQGVLLASVCTGAEVLAEAGLLAGRRATTHWGAVATLAAHPSGITVLPDARFVDDGQIVTAAGVSAGIDMALYLVGRLGGADIARLVRREMQYDPAPPV